jgi:response regulator RpfG family c-di-GMP phosphodiesterase
VRVILTGNADVSTAIEAVNCGAVFRFLTKPCPPKALTSAIAASLRQHQLIHAERRVLEQTVGAIVQVLTEILTLLNPVAACRAQRMRRYVEHMTTRLHLRNRWELEVAAMLSHLGSLRWPWMAAIRSASHRCQPTRPIRRSRIIRRSRKRC